MQFWIIFSLIIAFFLIAVLGMAVRVIFIKGAEARGGCAGKNPLLLEEGVACGLCGAKPGEECKEDEMPKIVS
ncbi:MAG: hypothetical protein JXR19_08850 [Bacteroidia bacterium]